jgi:hypothetical protein
MGLFKVVVTKAFEARLTFDVFRKDRIPVLHESELSALVALTFTGVGRQPLLSDFCGMSEQAAHQGMFLGRALSQSDLFV